jgi:hypothetical protein
MYEFLKDNVTTSQRQNGGVTITTVTFIADGNTINFSVGSSIGTLFSVSINGLGQIRNQNFTYTDYTSTIIFLHTPLKNSIITVQYYKGINSVILDNVGKLIQFAKEEFIFTGLLDFNLSNSINSLMTVETNGLAEEDAIGYDITSDKQITYNYDPVLGSKISISYLY